MSNLKIDPAQVSTLSDLDQKGETSTHKPASEQSSPLPNIPSRNFENQDWLETVSAVGDESVQEDAPRCSRVSTVLRKTKTQVTGISELEPKESQAKLSKKEIKNSLNAFFKELMEKFSPKGVGENLDFHEAVQAYLAEKGDEKDHFSSDSDNLLNKSLKLVDQLTKLSTDVDETNKEKLVLFISILADQLEIHNHKYNETRKQQVNSTKEKNYLQKYNSSTLNVKSSGKWCQINKSLTKSTLTIQLDAIKRKLKTIKFPSHNYYFILKGDGHEIAKTTLNDSVFEIKVNLSKDDLYDGLTIEVYELSPSTMIGECQFAVEEIFENTLFNKNFRIELPIIPTEESLEPYTASTNAVSHNEHNEAHQNQERPSAMNDQQFNDYLQTLLHEGKKCDLLRVSFQVNLDTSFVEIIEDMREQRIKSLEAGMDEIKAQANEQADYLRLSIAPIKTLMFDYDFGIRSIFDIQELGKARDKSSCGVCTGDDNKCSIF